MTFSELLKASANGLPRVQALAPGAKRPALGIVTLIKSNRGYHGCAVQFDGRDYDTWFYAEDGNDGRKRYMKELSLEDTENQPLYVVVKKARGSKGVYHEVMTQALPFENAKVECSGMHISLMTDEVLDFYVSIYNGKAIGEDYC